MTIELAAPRGQEGIVQSRPEVAPTKLRPPRLPSDRIARPELISRLLASLERELTLVSAPAGFGKTTLLCGWLATLDRPAAWLSLDALDSDLTSFVRGLVAALQTIAPEFGRSTLSLWQLPELPPVAFVAATMAKELANLTPGSVLVLDDYHAIRDPAVHELLAALLARLPAQLHLVLATREDPPIGISLLRARQQLVEVRAPSLRFSGEETHAFLERAVGANIPAESAALVADRTEGWGVGLRLAALALREQPDPVGWARAFQVGSHRYVREFLLDEVLTPYPPEVLGLLQCASIAERFCAPLCAALGGGNGSAATCQRILQRLEHANCFLVALDDESRWYRLHHLFQEALQSRLRAEHDPAAVAALHQRAQAWFAEQGLMEEAIRHAIAAGDAPGAAALVEARVQAALSAEEWTTVERWLALLPASETERRPHLLLARAWVLYFRHGMADLPALLDRADAALARAGEGADLEALRGEIDALRSAVQVWSGAPRAAREPADRARGRLPAGYEFARGIAGCFYVIALQQCGQGAEALRLVEAECMGPGEGEPVVAARLLLGAATCYFAAADLSGLERCLRRTLALAESHRFDVARAWAHYGLGRVCYERDDLLAAEEHYAAAVALRHRANHFTVWQSLIGLALTHQALGDPARASETVRSLAELVAAAEDLPAQRLMQSVVTRLALRRGDHGTVARWLRTTDGPGALAPGHSIEAVGVTHAQALLAVGSKEAAREATRELTALAEQSAAWHDHWRGVEIRALQALAHQAQGEREQALATLAEAVTAGEPGGLVRTFVDLGPPLADLLATLAHQQGSTPYLARLLGAVAVNSPAAIPPLTELRGCTASAELVRGPVSAPPPPAFEEPQSPLTWREIEVLQLLAQRQSNKEIAQALHITADTVKKHASNIYQKLQVGGRREAVARAATLGLLGDARQPDPTVLVPIASPTRASSLHDVPSPGQAQGGR
jgi:LuxR family maltose regulon positive regulatory protein